MAGQDKAQRALLGVVFEEDRPVWRGSEELNDLLWLGTEELAARFEFKLNLFRNQLGGAAIREVASGWNVSQFHGAVLGWKWRVQGFGSRRRLEGVLRQLSGSYVG